MSSHQSKHDVLVTKIELSILAYCETCDCEITNQEYYDYHYDGKHSLIDTYNYAPRHNGRTLASVISDVVNSQDRAIVAAGFIEGMTRQHRTLQEYTIFLLREILREYGKLGDEHVDGRNEHARKVAKLMGDAW